MAGNARRTRVGGVRGHVWAPQTKVRRRDRLARYVARRSRAPYLRRWALLIALARAFAASAAGLGPAEPRVVDHEVRRIHLEVGDEAAAPALVPIRRISDA